MVDIAELRAKAEARSRKVDHPEETEKGTTNTGSTFRAIRYFDAVRADRAKLKEAIEYYKSALENAKQHIVAFGNLQTLLGETPGLKHFYKCIHTDAQQIKKYLEDRYEVAYAEKYQWFLTSPEAKQKYGTLKVTDVKEFAAADPMLSDLKDEIRLVDYWEDMMENVALGFQDRSIMLNHITNIRVAGLEEVWVNPTQETKNQ